MILALRRRPSPGLLLRLIRRSRNSQNARQKLHLKMAHVKKVEQVKEAGNPGSTTR